MVKQIEKTKIFMIKIFNFSYPYLSIGFLEVSKSFDASMWIDILGSFSDVFTAIIQIGIGGLTVYKLVIDIRNKLKNKNNG